jgi:hypothetical protein
MHGKLFEKFNPEMRLRLTAEGDDGTGAGGDSGGDKPKGGEVISLPKEAFNDRLTRAGKAANAKLLEELGVSSLDELRGRLKPADDDDGERKPAKPKTVDHAAEATRLKRELEQATKRHEQEREELQLRNTLEREALKAGITDTDYALTLANREVKGLDEKKLSKWSPAEYFRALAKSKPHLCEQAAPEKEPATTGTNGDDGDDRPDPERGAGRNGAPPAGKKSNGAAFNALTATKADMQARLNALRKK